MALQKVTFLIFAAVFLHGRFAVAQADDDLKHAEIDLSTKHQTQEIAMLRWQMQELRTENEKLRQTVENASSVAVVNNTQSNLSQFISAFSQADTLLRLARNRSSELLLQLQEQLDNATSVLEDQLILANQKLLDLHYAKRFFRPCHDKKRQLRTQTLFLNNIFTSDVPNGIVCIGNELSSSPEHNFLVYNKTTTTMLWYGMQSKFVDFIGVVPYLSFVASANTMILNTVNMERIPFPKEFRGTLDDRDIFWTSNYNMYFYNFVVDDYGKIGAWNGAGANLTLWY